MAKIAKKLPETCDENILDPQNPLFCIKDKKNLYIQNVGHIWGSDGNSLPSYRGFPHPTVFI